MATMKAAQYTKANTVEIKTVPIPSPKQNQIRIKVKACGICHSDTGIGSGHMGNVFPRTAGHELAGVVDEVGEGVTQFKKGDRVAVGWFGGHCGSCRNCLQDAWVCCEKGQVCGLSYDGGWAEYTVVPVDAVARIPDGLDFKFAGPLMCAGITTFNAIRNVHAKSGEICVVQGIGGLGHLAVQYANKLGFNVVAVSSGQDKEELAKKLGAHTYIDQSTTDPVKKIQELGGAAIILATAPNAKAIASLVPALGVGGRLLIVSVVPEPVPVNSLTLLMKRASVTGWASGDSRDSQDTLEFSCRHGVEAMIETFTIDKIQEGIDKMLANKTRFRGVLVFE
eukprot:TRINITY_DN748_c0_g1_i1.p1 TRINITY_DN748_c0_g1~~TRINITY_DN748_c0_g1_i1.p1  ORF type:complete len:337 (+),score=54.42 TRINITY_DN748_c0_g1_i1:255-1265(+)